MTAFDARIYWPQPAPGAKLVNTFDASSPGYPQEIIQTYTNAGDGFMLHQLVKGVWDSDWYYRIDPDKGVLEYRDDYPRKWYDPPWQSKHQVWCVPGKEIFWGLYQEIGKAIGSQCVTSGLFGQWGWQELAFYDIISYFHTPAGTFYDVLVMEYWQEWGGGKMQGAKMWLAPGRGQIRAEWSLNKVPSGYSMMIKSSVLGSE